MLNDLASAMSYFEFELVFWEFEIAEVAFQILAGVFVLKMYPFWKLDQLDIVRPPVGKFWQQQNQQRLWDKIA